MKCLDTPLLEELLLGTASARRWLDRLGGGEEVATTEASLSELALRAQHRRPRSGLARRLAALGEVRRALVVLPLDSEASQRVADLVRRGIGGPPDDPFPLLILGTCLAHGVTELYTGGHRALPAAPGLKIVRVGQSRAITPTNRGRKADL